MTHPFGYEREAEFSRAPNPDRQFVEVRPLLTPDLCAWLDSKCAVASKKRGVRVDRTTMVKELLAELARQDYDDASVLLRVVGVNPTFMDGGDDGRSA